MGVIIYPWGGGGGGGGGGVLKFTHFSNTVLEVNV